MAFKMIQARAVSNAVFIEHVGESGDIAVWGAENADSAKFQAKQINRALLELWRTLLLERLEHSIERPAKGEQP